MRKACDAIFPANMPDGFDIYIGYTGGKWADVSAIQEKFPAKIVAGVDVSAFSYLGKILDVEAGDATPEQAPGWVQRRRAAGYLYPTVYVSIANWPRVKAAFAANPSVDPPLYWVADYSLGDDPAIPDGAIAIQYEDAGGYDISNVADYWPGVDPLPVEEDAMETVFFDVTAEGTDNPGVWMLLNGRYFHVTNPANLKALRAAFPDAPSVVIDTTQHTVLVTSFATPV